MEQPTKKIITHFVFPPIPDRTHDWCAYYEGDEETGRYGWGETKEEAIRELKENYGDNE